MPKRDATHMDSQRERILRAAIQCISDLGIERASVAQICKQSGLSVGAIYTHFSGKDAIIVEALRFSALTEAMLPDNWPDLKAALTSADDQMGFDVVTVARTRLQLFVSSTRPGPLHDMLKPLLERSLAMVAHHLETLADSGQIRLRMSALQTAMSLSAVVDGMILIGLGGDRPWDEVAADADAALDCLVEYTG